MFSGKPYDQTMSWTAFPVLIYSLSTSNKSPHCQSHIEEQMFLRPPLTASVITLLHNTQWGSAANHLQDANAIPAPFKNHPQGPTASERHLPFYSTLLTHLNPSVSWRKHFVHPGVCACAGLRDARLSATPVLQWLWNILLQQVSGTCAFLNASMMRSQNGIPD